MISLRTCRPNLQCQQLQHQAWSPATVARLQCNPSWILQWQMQNSLYTLYYGGVFKGRWVFKGNLVSTSISSLLLIILCLAVTLLTSTKVQLGSKELSFLTKENNTEVDYRIRIYIYCMKVLTQIIVQKKTSWSRGSCGRTRHRYSPLRRQDFPVKVLSRTSWLEMIRL